MVSGTIAQSTVGSVDGIDIHTRIELAARAEEDEQKRRGRGESPTVCCGCRPKGRRWRRKKGDACSVADVGESVFGDAAVGEDEEWNSTADSQFYFDAVEEPLMEYEYPVSITNKPPSNKPYVTMEEPETLLMPAEVDPADSRCRDLQRDTLASLGISDDQSQGAEDANDDGHRHRKPSMRLQTFLRRGTMEHKRQLESPRVKTPLRGFPGELTVEELTNCVSRLLRRLFLGFVLYLLNSRWPPSRDHCSQQRFVRELRKRDVAVGEQVYSLRDIEEEPYAICRFLRATKFDVDKILERLEVNKKLWLYAKAKKFYPDVSQAVGAPFSIFLSQYPNVPAGRARNGCPVNYFLAGKIQPEGLLCVTTVEQTQGYFWNQFMHKFVKEITFAQQADPNFVRCEGIQVIDLQGLSSNALTPDTFDVIKIAGKISEFFPEVRSIVTSLIFRP